LIVVIEGVVSTLNDRLDKIDNLMVNKVDVHGLKLGFGRSKVRPLIDQVGVSKFVVLRTPCTMIEEDMSKSSVCVREGNFRAQSSSGPSHLL